MAVNIISFVAASLLGSMVFFAVVVAPTVFRTLEVNDAGRFLRALFPRYYSWGLAVSGIGLLAAFWVGSFYIASLVAVVALFLYARQVLMPKINEARDAELEGDMVAKRQFASLHRQSVIVNGVQMLVLLATCVQIAAI